MVAWYVTKWSVGHAALRTAPGADDLRCRRSN